MTPVYFGSATENPQDEEPHTFFTEVSSKIYEHYMDYDIDDFVKARQLCTLLRGANEEDTVVIRINSGGGRFDIAAQIINAIKECAGTVIGVIEQSCASAATMIFLSCDQWQVQPLGDMMIHYASYGVGGKGNEISSRVDHNNRMLPRVFNTIYKDFLSVQEIENVIRGQDIYLTPDEITARLENVVANLKSEEEDDGNEELKEAGEYTQVSEDIEES
jgi:ATP-dependent protease ClpP protease subunit